MVGIATEPKLDENRNYTFYKAIFLQYFYLPEIGIFEGILANTFFAKYKKYNKNIMLQDKNTSEIYLSKYV